MVCNLKYKFLPVGRRRIAFNSSKLKPTSKVNLKIPVTQLD